MKNMKKLKTNKKETRSKVVFAKRSIKSKKPTKIDMMKFITVSQLARKKLKLSFRNSLVFAQKILGVKIEIDTKNFKRFYIEFKTKKSEKNVKEMQKLKERLTVCFRNVLKKTDTAQVVAVSKLFGMSPEERRNFGKYIEKEKKHIDGGGPGATLEFDDLVTLGQQFLEENNS
jgi:hypothetical protein